MGRRGKGNELNDDMMTRHVQYSYCNQTNSHGTILHPKRGSGLYDSGLNFQVDDRRMRWTVRRTDTHPTEGCAESICLYVQMIYLVTVGSSKYILQPFHLIFTFILLVIVIAFNRDTRPFAVYRINVQTRAWKLEWVEREKGSELTQSADAVAAATARKHGTLPLGSKYCRWGRIEKREDIHEASGMRDACELAHHILGAELGSGQVSHVGRCVEEERMRVP